ncbi:MAG: PEP-CTERM sorting domain-containing protein [Pirellulales bacterium]|nr:PEP-CTERM sorting domain-containing protein [Pirellulales bacterium]
MVKPSVYRTFARVAIVLAAANATTARASQIAFDYITPADNSHLVSTWLSASTAGGNDYKKVASQYQPLHAEYIDHFSALILGGTPTPGLVPPTNAQWALLNGLWRFQIWSVPASSPPVSGYPAIANYYWQTQAFAPVAVGNVNLLTTPIGGIPTPAGLSASGRQKWIAEFDLRSQNILLEPSRIYMIELSVVDSSGAPYIYIIGTDIAGLPGASVSKTPTQNPPGNLQYPAQNGSFAMKMTTVAVPEPESWFLLTTGGLAVLAIARRRRAWRGRRALIGAIVDEARRQRQTTA